MNWRRWHLVAGAAVLVAGGIAVGRRMGPSGPAVLDAGHVAEDEAAAPPDLLAEMTVASPNASWNRLQRGVGGAMAILPATVPGVLLALADLDTAFANELDGAAPMQGVVAGDPADPAVVVAVPLVDPARARSTLVDAGTARFSTQDVAGMTLLVPARASGAQHGMQLALTTNGYLVVGRRTADLEHLAPYATRTLPGRKLAGTHGAVVAVPRAAIATVLKPRLARMWADAKAYLQREDERMRAERGRAPDFGDPVAILAAIDGVVGKRIDVFGDLDKIELALDIVDDAVVLDATLTPVTPPGEAKRWVEDMKVGDVSAAFALPASSLVAWSSRDGEAAREEQAKEAEKAVVSALGARLKDPAKLHDVFAAMTKARDESVAVAVRFDDPSGVFVRAPVRDPAAAEKAIRGAFDLAKSDPLKELLAVRDLTQGSDELSGLGRVSTLMLARDGKPSPKAKAGAGKSEKNAAPSSLGGAWNVDGQMLSAAFGSEPLVVLRSDAKPERKLADEPALTRFAAAVGGNAAQILILQPLRLDPKRANLPTAPFALAVGKRDSTGFVHVDVADGLFREVARWQMGF